MAKICKFEEIEAWAEARELAKRIYQQTANDAFKRDTALRDQIRRATVSIMANIAEGFDCGSNKEFIQFLRYSLRSATEVQSHLYVAADQDYMTQQEFRELQAIAITIKNLICGFLRYLNSGAPHPKSTLRQP